MRMVDLMKWKHTDTAAQYSDKQELVCWITFTIFALSS